MRWFHISVDDFENSLNPENASLNIMIRNQNENGDQFFEIDHQTKNSLNLFNVHPRKFIDNGEFKI